MDDPIIDLEFAPDGRVKVHISGVSGEDCEALERLVLEALGGEGEARERSPEYYARQGVLQRLRSRLKL